MSGGTLALSDSDVRHSRYSHSRGEAPTRCLEPMGGGFVMSGSGSTVLDMGKGGSWKGPEWVVSIVAIGFLLFVMFMSASQGRP